MEGTIARLLASAERARERARIEAAREYEGWGERPEAVAAYWERMASAAEATVNLMREGN